MRADENSSQVIVDERYDYKVFCQCYIGYMNITNSYS